MPLLRQNIRDGNVAYPHCNGKTTCACGSCGVQKPYFDRHGNQKDITIVEGICKVCNGTGQVPK